MLSPYSTWGLFEPKVFHVGWCKFLQAEVPGKLMGRDYRTEITARDGKIPQG